MNESNLSNIARIAAEKIIDEFVSCLLVPDGYTHKAFYGRRMGAIIESVLRDSGLARLNEQLVNTLSTRADREREMLAEVEVEAFTSGYEQAKKDGMGAIDVLIEEARANIKAADIAKNDTALSALLPARDAFCKSYNAIRSLLPKPENDLGMNKSR